MKTVNWSSPILSFLATDSWEWVLELPCNSDKDNDDDDDDDHKVLRVCVPTRTCMNKWLEEELFWNKELLKINTLKLRSLTEAPLGIMLPFRISVRKCSGRGMWEKMTSMTDTLVLLWAARSPPCFNNVVKQSREPT